MLRRKKSKERGAAAVEFALVLPLFLWLVLGTIDFGYYFFVSEIVTNAAREGARAGSVLDPNTADTAVKAEAEQRTKDYLGMAGLESLAQVTATPGPVSGVPAVHVHVEYPVGSVTGFLSFMMPSHSKADAVMRWQ